ncbi:hypothetical protein [Herbaspirillum sp. VT-16-41]|uniref:hypothetical protein n=1 Tax=Herbaspirillum sp. VT-16-41 TaxID=1953765 RepID=UPI001115505C|nr:hypothetical protein [Herbaspirillum sp. VT-16-41]
MKSKRFKAASFLPINGVALNSDISSVTLNDQGYLVVILACFKSENTVSGLRISFPPPIEGFRLLDELALHRYVRSKEFPHGSHLIEVLEGGWLSEECELQELELEMREWMVVSGNGCLSVFCSGVPQCSKINWEFRKD